MSRVPEDERISLKLSDVLREIGVSERTVMMRRRYTLLQNVHVIQDCAEWKPDVENMLIVQDETTSPGYCLLQILREDSPQAATHAISNYYRKDDKGRILCKHTKLNQIIATPGVQQNGPASTVSGLPGYIQLDIVSAFHCESWPVEGRRWLDRQCVGNWPSMDIRRLAESKGCFIVPVGSKCNNMTDVEWRISTSMAERLMMFNLNITQIRCYVMLKMISKTFFTMNGESLITSFMNKCTLFHCIENTPKCHWREDNLFPCLMKCICLLQDRVQNLNCPHYIIPTNNLMAHRIDADQQQYLLQVIDRLVRRNIDMFFAIEMDDLGKMFQMKMNNLYFLPGKISIEVCIDKSQQYDLGRAQNSFIRKLLRYIGHHSLAEAASKLIDGIRWLQIQYHTFSDIEAEASAHFVPLLCTVVGSVLASYSVYTNTTVSPEAIWWFSAGLNSDVSSSRLKLASAFYCAGDINKAGLILRALEDKYTDAVIPRCSCRPFQKDPLPEWWFQWYTNKGRVNEMIAWCVKFARCEMSIIPQGLRQELFRSTAEEIQTRSVYDELWMDLAVVDSRPYLHFLQYKVFKHQGRHQEQRKAFGNLLKTTLHEPNLAHRETAWNLLGQCKEQENMPVDALWCYDRSQEVCSRNNAANFHKARLRGIQCNPSN